MPWRSSAKWKSKQKTKKPIPCQKDTYYKTSTIHSSWSCITLFKTLRNCTLSWIYFQAASFSSCCENTRNSPKKWQSSMLLKYCWLLSIYTRKTSSIVILNLKTFFLIRMDISNLLILDCLKSCSLISKWPIVYVELLNILHPKYSLERDIINLLIGLAL